MNVFSATKHISENYLQSSIEHTYRKYERIIDLGSATTTYLLSEDMVKDMVINNVKSLSELITNYPSMTPNPCLERQLAKRLGEEFGVSFTENQFVIFRGILGGALWTLSAFREGRYIIVPENIYQNYKVAFVRYGKTVIEAKVNEYGLIDLDNLVAIIKIIGAEDIAFVYAYSVHGKMPNRRYIEKFAALASRSNFLIAYDADIIFTAYSSPENNSFQKLSQEHLDNVIVLCNLTKEFGAPGLRIGYGITNRKLADQLKYFQSESMEMVPAINKSIAASIVDSVCIDDVRNALKRRMYALVSGLNGLGWKVEAPDTGINLFIKVPKSFANSSVANGGDLFNFYLISEVGVLARSGSIYSVREKDKIRFVVSHPEEQIKDAISRMAEKGVSPSMSLPRGIEEAYMNFCKKHIPARQVFEEAEKETRRLLKLYEEYRKIEAEITVLGRNRRGLGNGKTKSLSRNLMVASNKIRFSNPIVWMMFIGRRGLMANRAEDRIKNFRDFRNHCAADRSTCSSRWRFIDLRLKQSGICLLDQTEFPDNMPLEEAYSRKDVVEALMKDEVVSSWKSYEFYAESDRPAKWKNFA